MAFVLFGPPALAILLALAAMISTSTQARDGTRWLARASLFAGLLGLAAVAYMMAIFTDPLHFHETGVLTMFPTSAQPGLVLALAASVGPIVASVVLWLSRRAPRENAAALPV